MAKRGTLLHPKTQELADLLGIDPPSALGLLSGLWEVVGEYAPHGDISQLRAAHVCRMIQSRLDPERVWEALIAVGFVDRVGERLLIHNWSQHSEDWVHKRLKSRGECFADGRPPFSRADPSEGKAARGRQDSDLPTARRTHAEGKPPGRGAAASGTPAARLPEPTPEPTPTPGPEPPRESAPPPPPPAETAATATGTALSPEEIEQAWKAFAAIYPPRDGDRKLAQGRERFVRLLQKGEAVEAILEGARQYREWARSRGLVGSAYVKQVPTWLNGRCWEEAEEAYPVDPPEPTRSGPPAPPPRLAAANLASRREALRQELGLR